MFLQKETLPHAVAGIWFFFVLFLFLFFFCSNYFCAGCVLFLDLFYLFVCVTTSKSVPVLVCSVNT